MQIDLKQPSALTPAAVRDLLGSASDATDTQLCVTKDGVAFVRAAADDTSDLLFRIETWIRGNDYVGPGAAQDSKWVERVYNAIRNNWPTPEAEIIDMF